MITFGCPQFIVDKSIKKIIAEVRPLFCWRCQHFGNKRSSNPSLRVLRIRKGKFSVKNCSLAHIASVHNCLLCCQHLFEFLGFPRLGSLGFPPSVWSSWVPWAPNTINIWWAPIASNMVFGSDGSPAHLGSPADIDGVGSPGSPGSPDHELYYSRTIFLGHLGIEI